MTYFNGTRCDLAEFELIKKSYRNTVVVLDGCMLMSIGKKDEFYSLTYNTYAKVYELAYLRFDPEPKFDLFYGPKQGDLLRLRSTRDGYTVIRSVSLENGEVRISNEKKQ